jgi:hypothetical protein
MGDFMLPDVTLWAVTFGLVGAVAAGVTAIVMIIRRLFIR